MNILSSTSLIERVYEGTQTFFTIRSVQPILDAISAVIRGEENPTEQSDVEQSILLSLE